MTKAANAGRDCTGRRTILGSARSDFEPTFPTVEGELRIADDLGTSKPGPVVVRVCDVDRQEVDWLWPGRFALRKISLIAGNAGLGKSFVSLDLAARVSKGRAWTDLQDGKNPAGDVILLSCEDGIGDTIRPRLEAHDADLERVHVLTGVQQAETPDSTSMFSLERDLRHLETTLRERPGTRVVIIDPLSAYFGRDVKSHNDADVRRVLGPLAELAEPHNVAVVGIIHLNKSSGQQQTNALHRVMGSVAIAAAARAAWLICRDKDDDDGKRRLFLQVKNNLAPNPGGLAFTIEEPGAVHWEPGTVDVDADDALAPRRGPEPEALEEAIEFVMEALAGDAMEADDLDGKAKVVGVSQGTLKRAKAALRKAKKIDCRKRTIAGKTGWAWWIVKDDE